MQQRLLALAIGATLMCGIASPIRSYANQVPQGEDLSQIQTIVVIYAENRAFDHMYGHFPGANGLDSATPSQMTQVDRDGSVLPVLPPINGNGLTAPSDPTQIPTDETENHPNEPYALDDPNGYNVDFRYKLHDLVHRFYNNQMQINHGLNNMFAAWSDAGGEVMGYWNDTDTTAMYWIASQYTLADNFFQGAFGGSFLNHQYLICACAPFDFKTEADPITYAHNISAVNPDGVSLQVDPSSPASALDGVPVYVNDSVLTPDYYGINTMQPPYQPSGNPPADGGDPAYSDPALANTLSPQTAENIGDLLTQAGVSWAWYAGAWQAALDHDVPTGVSFQYHHQPFNYYEDLSPAHPDARAEHLRDGGIDGAAFIQAIDAGTLPHVTFYKPEGRQNQHAGYANIQDGDAHIADVISHLEQSPQWHHMVVVVTYDEMGGWWDHVPPPQADRWGPGTRVPAIIVSPFAKRGFVDHTQYDTASVLRLITHVFGLPTLPGITMRDTSLEENGLPPMGDLTNALDFSLDDSIFQGNFDTNNNGLANP